MLSCLPAETPNLLLANAVSETIGQLCIDIISEMRRQLMALSGKNGCDDFWEEAVV